MPATENELDFWADDIQVEVLTPLMILRAQEPALRKKTKGILRAEVTTRETEDRQIHELSLIAPALDNYRERILSIEHKKNIVYPCDIASEGIAGMGHNNARAPSQTQFMAILKQALQSDFVRSTIDSLLAKSNEIQSKNGFKVPPQPF